ncbi:hypothetical protein RNAN_3665 [Rheinheimera nanhaiensis E407-8]|uniref:Uncharacterized protein n=1 Tax=Rheinheimera nanhaiensis E407-8 TaxID=562729 RepID=I1E2W1_9GAMM|nr:hypothetical protein RNAN_3665 [Rheinheimera nanhaiensis E407-8]
MCLNKVIRWGIAASCAALTSNIAEPRKNSSYSANIIFN